MSDTIGKPAGQRSRFATGPPVRSRGPFDDGQPSSPIADAQARGTHATGPARYIVEHALLKAAGKDKGRNVRIKPDELLGRRL